MKRIPYSLQGLLFAPAFIGVIFVLKVTCPAPTGQGCFADNFLTTTFMPLTFLYKVFDRIAPVVAHHEPLFILGYWAAVGFVAGLLFDVLREISPQNTKKDPEEDPSEMETLY